MIDDLCGKHVVLTGRLESLTRQHAQELVTWAGSTVAKKVSNTTDVLICGARTGAKKISQAASLGIRVMEEDDFLALLANPSVELTNIYGDDFEDCIDDNDPSVLRGLFASAYFVESQVDGAPWMKLAVPGSAGHGEVFFDLDVDRSGGTIMNAFSAETFAEVDAEMPSRDLNSDYAELEIAKHLWSRARWITERLQGDSTAVPAPAVNQAVWKRERQTPGFVDSPAYIIYWLWDSYYRSNDARAAELTLLAQTSSLGVVRSAGEIIARLLDGQETFAAVNVAEQRRLLSSGGKLQPKREAKTKAKAKVEPLSEAERQAKQSEFEAAIIDAPKAKRPFAAYADWLVEYGDPRGELIHVQLLLENKSLDYKERKKLVRKERRLLKQFTEDWLGPVSATFRRGFLREADVDLNDAHKSMRQSIEARFLQNLKIGRCASLKYLPELPALRSLIACVSNLTDAKLAHVKRAPRLQRLNIAATKVTNKGLAHLSALAELQELHLDNTKITDAGLKFLQPLASLKTLHLRRLPISDTGLARLATMTGLRELDFFSPDLTDSGLAHLTKLKQLQRLYLDDTHVTDAGLAHLANIPTLEALSLYHAKVTDAGIAHLTKLPALEKLDLTGTKVSDDGLMQLAVLDALKSVTVPEDTVTAAGVKRLRKARPRCKVEREMG